MLEELLASSLVICLGTGAAKLDATDCHGKRCSHPSLPLPYSSLPSPPPSGWCCFHHLFPVGWCIVSSSFFWEALPSLLLVLGCAAVSLPPFLCGGSLPVSNENLIELFEPFCQIQSPNPEHTLHHPTGRGETHLHTKGGESSTAFLRCKHLCRCFWVTMELPRFQQCFKRTNLLAVRWSEHRHRYKLKFATLCVLLDGLMQVAPAAAKGHRKVGLWLESRTQLCWNKRSAKSVLSAQWKVGSSCKKKLECSGAARSCRCKRKTHIHSSVTLRR